MKKSSVLILGGKSDIGLAIAHRFADQGHPIHLAMRQAAAEEPIRSDIEIRYGVTSTLHEFDVLETSKHTSFVDALPAMPDVVICVVGFLGSQTESEQNNNAAITVFRSNFEGPASILAIFAAKFETRGSGTIIGISSVAGERGRSSNYVYGSAKAGFTAFLSGLRNRLAKKKIQVITVLPGYVSTRMTEGMKLPKAITSSPQEIADLVYSAVGSKKDIVYSRFWYFIMIIVRNIPERIFKHLKL